MSGWLEATVYLVVCEKTERSAPGGVDFSKPAFSYIVRRTYEYLHMCRTL